MSVRSLCLPFLYELFIQIERGETNLNSIRFEVLQVEACIRQEPPEHRPRGVCYAWREDLYDRVDEQLGKRTTSGAIDGACEFTEQIIPNLKRAIEHLDMTEEVAEVLSTQKVRLEYWIETPFGSTTVDDSSSLLHSALKPKSMRYRRHRDILLYKDSSVVIEGMSDQTDADIASASSGRSNTTRVTARASPTQLTPIISAFTSVRTSSTLEAINRAIADALKAGES